MGSGVLCSFIISICLTHIFAKSLNHIHFNVAPIKLTKTFSTLPQSLDTIDEEENFWSIPKPEQKHHSTKLEHFPKHYDGESNLIENQNKHQSLVLNPIENFSTLFGLPNNSPKNVPKTGKAEDQKIFDQQSNMQNRPEKLMGTNLERNPEVEKDSNVKKASESKTDIDISDLIILDELTEKLNDKSISFQSQQGFLPKKAKLFTPNSDSFKTSYLKNEFLFNKQKHNSIENIENNNDLQKDFDFNESKIKNQLKNDFSFDSKNPSFLFKDLKKIPLHHFSQHLGNLFESENSNDFPKFSVLKHLPENSVAMTSIFILPSQSHFKDVSMREHDEIDSEMTKNIFRPTGKLFFNKNLMSDNKQESLLNISNEWNQVRGNNDSKSKKEIEKLSNIPVQYPVLYQFLEKFSDKIFEAALKY